MKLGLVFGSVLFLVAGITLAGNSQEVTGLSDLELTNIAANATANATGAAMEEANKLLGAAKNASAKATQTGIEQTKSVLANVTNNVTNATSNTTGTAMNEANKAVNESSHTYENTTQGIRFQYPSNWREVINDFCLTDKCPVGFFITAPKLDTVNTTSSNPSDCAGNEPKGQVEVTLLGVLKKCDVYKMTVVPTELDKPIFTTKPCNCKTLKDFVAWDYTRGNDANRTFINDNQTIIGNNYSAWQTETEFKSGIRFLTVYAINGNVGYKFLYDGPADNRFDRYLEGFKNMLKSVTLTTPIPEKKPSFLNSSDTADTSILPSTPTVQDNSFKILSSNDFIDSIGTLHVVGEVQNNTPTNAQFVKITGTFYDSSNNVVGTDFTYTDPYDIGSGQKAPFDLTLLSASIPISQVDHYNLVASSQ